MQRYFVPAANWQQEEVTITGDDFHHIVRVMRMDEGAKIICNHPSGRAAECKIESTNDQQVTAAIVKWLNETTELPVQLTIAQGLPKGDKMEWILQKGTELGAYAFLPFQAERSVVKWDSKKAEKKLARYQKIVKEASEQSHRSYVPEVYPITSFESLLKNSASFDIKIFAYEEEAKSDTFSRLSEIFEKAEKGQSILACIGPEGGYSPVEVQSLKAHGFYSTRLGPRILRTETAPLYLLSSLSYHFEEMR